MPIVADAQSIDEALAAPLFHDQLWNRAMWQWDTEPGLGRQLERTTEPIAEDIGVPDEQNHLYGMTIQST